MLARKYTILELPSRGECYPSKVKTVKMRDMTVSDEDMFTTDVMNDPLAAVDLLIDRCLVGTDLMASEMCTTDREYVMLWLRRNGYGDEYEYIAGETGERKSLDLSKVKFIYCEVTGDEKGYFELRHGDDILKFKLLTHIEDEILYVHVKDAVTGVEGDRYKPMYKAILMDCIVSVNGEGDDNYKERWLEGLDGEELKDIAVKMLHLSPRVDRETTDGLELSDNLLTGCVINRNDN